MKHLLPTIMIGFALFVACKVKGSESVTNMQVQVESQDTIKDTIIAADDSSAFSFLAKLGIDYKPLIAKGDTLPVPSAKNFRLTTKEQRSLLNGVIAESFDKTSKSPVRLVSVRQIYDDIVLCQYNFYRSKNLKCIYLATYNTKGVLIDAMFAGYRWGKYKSDNNNVNVRATVKLVTSGNESVYFIDNYQFISERDYKELVKDDNSGQDSTTYSKSISMTYNIEPDGKIKLHGIDESEDGVFRYWGEYGKEEWDLYDEMQTISRYPYSDETLLEQWEKVGQKVDGAPAETFSIDFYRNICLPQPQRALKWIYKNRDIEFDPLRTCLESEYKYDKPSQDIIDAAISALEDTDMRAYYKNQTDKWKVDPLD